jgi:hypothetical protein
LSAQMSTLGRMVSRGTEKESTTGCPWGEGGPSQSSSGGSEGLSHQYGGTLPRLGSRWEARPSTIGGTGGREAQHRVYQGVGETCHTSIEAHCQGWGVGDIEREHYRVHRGQDRFEPECAQRE